MARALRLWGDICWLPNGKWRATVGTSDHILSDTFILFRRDYRSHYQAEGGMEAAYQRCIALAARIAGKKKGEA